tara:strand:+ start:6203 stop:6682 length:480 start_codon:yes stop_codon:yes gene_type:complete
VHCPFCHFEDSRVVDTRLSDDGISVRRRRVCQACNERFTTYERAELRLPQVIKADGGREQFNESKLRGGILRALEKRPVDTDRIETSISRILHRLRVSGEREVSTTVIGEYVMVELGDLDEVAYVRFASVYRRFQDLDEFSKEVARLLSRHSSGKKGGD